MEAILKFDLPIDKDNYTAASKGMDYWFCLWDLDQWLRSEIKYNDQNKSAEVINVLETVREELYDIMNDHNVTMQDIS